MLSSLLAGLRSAHVMGSLLSPSSFPPLAQVNRWRRLKHAATVVPLRPKHQHQHHFAQYEHIQRNHYEAPIPRRTLSASLQPVAMQLHTLLFIVWSPARFSMVRICVFQVETRRVAGQLFRICGGVAYTSAAQCDSECSPACWLQVRLAAGEISWTCSVVVSGVAPLEVGMWHGYSIKDRELR